jgi:hypothetical protein
MGFHPSAFSGRRFAGWINTVVRLRIVALDRIANADAVGACIKLCTGRPILTLSTIRLSGEFTSTRLGVAAIGSAGVAVIALFVLASAVALVVALVTNRTRISIITLVAVLVGNKGTLAINTFVFCARVTIFAL